MSEAGAELQATQKQRDREADESSLERWLPLLLCAVAALLYVATLQFEFVYDDRSQIVFNPLVQTWRSFTLLFSTDVWRFQNPLVVGNYWRPMFMVWLLINHSLFGLKAAGWHALSVALHVACTYLLYRLTLRLSADKWLAFFAGMLFAVHPTHLETVAWISGATDSLMCVFLLGSLLAFIRALDKDRQKSFWIALCTLLYLGALLTKETAIVEPIFIAAYVLIFAEESRNRLQRISASIVAALPFVAASALYFVQRHVVLHGFSHPYLDMPLVKVLITVPSMLWFYAQHLVWPVRLSVVYDAIPVVHIGWGNFWWPLLACGAIAAALIVYLVRTRDRAAGFAALLMLLPILPVLYIPALESDTFLHDRYLYLPSMGFAMLVAIALRKIRVGQLRIFTLPATQAIFATALLLAGATATSSQEIYWANDILLFDRAVTIAPGSASAFNNLGTALAAKGRRQEAMFAFQQVIRRNPGSWAAQYNVGLGYFMDGKYAECESYLEKAIALYPVGGDPPALLADARIRQGKFAAAEGAIRYAISVMPYKPGYRRLLALSLEGQGKLEEAIQAAQEELARFPNENETETVLNRLRVESRHADSISPKK